MLEALTEVECALTRLKNGKAEYAVADFAENFHFNDLGHGLEFTDREKLREFFEKERSFIQTPRFGQRRLS